MTSNNSPARPPMALTVAAALAAVRTWEDISPGRRSAFCRALTTIATLERRSADSVALDAKRSIGLLEAASPAQVGLQASSLANLRAGLRFVLRRLGLLAPRRAATPQVKEGEWASLLEKLPLEVNFHRLRQFVAFCAERGISPQAVSLQTLEDYGLQREATWGGAKRADHIRRVAALWRRAAKLLPEWPQTPIKPAPERQLSFDFGAYPAPLATEVERYLSEIAAPETVIKIFDHDSSRSAVSKATVNTRRYGLRRLFFGAVKNGFPIERINSLAIVVQQDFIKTALEYHFDRNGQKKNADIESLAATIASVMNYLKIPDPHRSQIKILLKKVKPDPQLEITKKNANILHEYGDPTLRLKLLHLPAFLMKRAAKMRDGWTDKQGRVHAPKPIDAAWLATLAAAIEIELHLPLRIRNLVELRLGEEITLAKAPSGKWRGQIRVDASVTKNGIGVATELNGESLQLVRTYLDEYRSNLPNAHTNWLFPGKSSPLKPRDKATFGAAIAETVHQYVGFRVNPHAFRCIVATLILEADPNAIDDVRAILGHSTFDTALKYYRGNETKGAAARHSQNLTQMRRKPLKVEQRSKKSAVPFLGLQRRFK
jgi:integrase